MRYMILALGVALAVVVPGESAPCVSGSCTVVQAEYEWRPAGEQQALFCRGVQIGNWTDGAYYALQNGAWVKSSLPWEPNFGVVQSKIDGPSYSHSGKTVTRAQAIQAIEASVPDDSAKRKVVVIGSEADRKAALEIIGKPSWAQVTDWSPDAFQVKDAGYKTDGKPTTYVVEANGGVVHRQDDLRDLNVAVRKADPNYKWQDDPDLRKAEPPAPDAPKSNAVLYSVVAVIAGLALLGKKGTM